MKLWKKIVEKTLGKNWSPIKYKPGITYHGPKTASYKEMVPDFFLSFNSREIFLYWRKNPWKNTQRKNKKHWEKLENKLGEKISKKACYFSKKLA